MKPITNDPTGPSKIRRQIRYVAHKLMRYSGEELDRLIDAERKEIVAGDVLLADGLFRIVVKVVKIGESAETDKFAHAENSKYRYVEAA